MILQVYIDGYHHKLHLLLESIMAEITEFEIDPERFKEMKDSVSFLTTSITLG